jgi:hypothetical protein
MLSADLTDFKNLELFLKTRGLKQFTFAAKGFLDSAAFKLKDLIFVSLNKNMVIRSEKFIKRKIRVQKTKGMKLSKMSAEVGTVRGPRFTGFVEQEKGKKDPRTRTQTLASRRGKFSNKVSGKARTKTANTFLDPDQEGVGKTRQARLTSFLSMVRKGTIKNQPFKTRRKYKGRLKRFSRGIFQMKKKKMMRLQSFKKPKQPIKKSWMKPAIRMLANKFKVKPEWAKQVRRQLKFK